jgi:hypothetical protein
MLRLLPTSWLRKLGYTVAYECEWGSWDSQYDAIDHHMSRPIHKDMSVAPPWAKRVITKGETP